MNTLELLERLVAFPSVSADGNLPIIGFIETFLRERGATVERVTDAGGRKAGLLARIGPAGDGGVLLSGHTDVVPVTGQDWSREPFRLTRDGARVYGRGTTDMKGFVAAALAAAGQAAGQGLMRPLLLSLSWDEELGCLGIRQMIDRVIPVLGRPEYGIVGEPTLMRVANGHKGKGAYLATCRGTAGHSAMAPRFCNALHLAADFVGVLRAEQTRLMAEGARDAAYDVTCSTVHAGRMAGGVALNIVPDSATVAFEIRHLAEEPVAGILDNIRAGAARAVAAAGHPAAAIEIVETNLYPGLDTPAGAEVVGRVAALAGDTDRIKVAYGTEAGFFAAKGIPTVVCGPGSMDQGHQPDEFIDLSQLAACDAMLDRLVRGLCR
ncbi:MAG: acetylornithine deacetylase [Proteobacteria bacterium]|nr:acetylornithine deacetylase [Pseudomonadota bacterium]